MRIVYLGSGSFGVPSLNAINASGHEICFIATQPAARAGRGRVPKPTAISTWAQKWNHPFLETPDVNQSHIIEEIKRHEPELLVVIAFGQKLGKEVISTATYGAINVHASLLPKLRGAAPINWAIVNGESETGISIITLAEKMDAGEVLAQKSVKIRIGETAGELHDRLAEESGEVLLSTIDDIEQGKAIYTPQDHSKATLAAKLKKKDGRLNFGMPADVLERRIRGFWPWPEACANYVNAKTGKCKRVILASAETIELAESDRPFGSLDSDLNIVCGKGALKIKKLKAAGGSLMDFSDFVNGYHCQAGDLFMEITE
jgi:methionyl-tRNA formyltransferase